MADTLAQALKAKNRDKFRNVMGNQSYSANSSTTLTQQEVHEGLKAVWRDPVAEACEKLDATIQQTNLMLKGLEEKGTGGDIKLVVGEIIKLNTTLTSLQENKSATTAQVIEAFIGGVVDALDVLQSSS